MSPHLPSTAWTSCILAALLSLATGTGSLAQTGSPGAVSFARRTASDFDPYTNSPSLARQQWLQTYFTRMGVFAPYFDKRTSWYSGGQVYQDLYAIYAG
jgi:hypothetical protein